MCPLLRPWSGLLVTGLSVSLLVLAGPTSRGPAAVSPDLRAVSSWSPRTGATFNRPLGNQKQENRIHALVSRTIDATPRHATIRMAVFSLSRKVTVDALLRARHRGVRVRVIFDNHTVYDQERRLRRELGGNPHARSYVLFCRHACRGRSGDMHDKVITFSRSGGRRYVTMVGSNNMTSYNAEHQWADVYTAVGNRKMYRTFSGLFDKLRKGRLRPSYARVARFYTRSGRHWKAEMFPARHVTRRTDPVMRSLSRIGCRAGRGTGVRGHTKVRVAQHAWYGHRGRYLAAKMISLRRHGCVVQVIPGVGVGDGVRHSLRHAGVSVARVRHGRNRTHEKVLTVSGRYGRDRTARVVFTGSHNWTDHALRCDDIVLMVKSARVYRQYARSFRYAWRHG